MFFRIAGDAKTEGVHAGDFCGELIGIAKPVGMRLERRLAARWVAAQRENVFDAASRQLLEDCAHFGFRMSDAGKVRHRLDAHLIFDSRD